MTDIARLVRSVNPVPRGQSHLIDAELDALLVLINERNGATGIEEMTRRSQPLKTRPRSWLVAVAAAVVVLVALVPMVLFSGDSGPDVGGTSPDVATTVSPTTVLQVPTLTPSVWSRVPIDAAVFGGAGSQRMFGVTAGGPGLVAVGESDGDAAVWTSVDGLIWSRVPHDEATFGGEGAPLMFDVIPGGPGLVAVGSVWNERRDVNDAAVWTSVDGLIWSRVPHDEAVFGGAGMSSVTAGGPGLVAVGTVSAISPGADRDAAVWTSVDGLIWSRVPHDEAVFGGVNNQEIMSVVAGGPGLVAVGTDGYGIIDESSGQIAAVWTSVDGIEWSRVPREAVSGRSGNYPMWSVTAGGPGLVAVGWDGSDAAVWTSADGFTWSQVPYDDEIFGATGGWGMVSVSAAGPGLVAVGDAVWTSVDGRTWSLADIPAGFDTAWSVTAAGPGLVSVGNDDEDAAVWVSDFPTLITVSE